jgi:lysophospholipase
MMVAMRGDLLLKRINRMFRPADQATTFLCVMLCLAGCGQRASAPDLPHAPASLTPRFYAPRGWTWGTIKLVDGQALRYGVASPPVVPRANVLILPDRSEPAEVWFETVGDLTDRGYTVWVLEAAEARGAGALDPAKGALQTMAGAVIRPSARQPLVLVGQGLGATLALRAMAEGRAPGVQAALIASPTLELASIDMHVAPEQVETAAEWASRARLGWIELPGDGQPRLTHVSAVGLDPRRAGLAAAWRRSDPSLQPRRTTLGWVWGYDQTILAARGAASLVGVTAQVVMAATSGDQRAIDTCKGMQACTLWAVPTSAPHLSPDAVRKLWLDRIAALVDSRPRGRR